MKWTRRQLEGTIAIAAVLAVLTAAGSLLRCIPPADVTPPWGNERSGPVVTEVAAASGSGKIYFMPAGATVADLLRAARIPRPDRFDHSVVNAALYPGIRMRTGSGAHLEVGEMSAGHKLLFGLPLDVNTATYGDLLLLPGIGEKLALRIIEWRRTHGNFKHIDELTGIQGIKEKRLPLLSRYLVVNDTKTK